MAELKLKIKKCGLVRKLDNEKVKGYYGKVSLIFTFAVP